MESAIISVGAIAALGFGLGAAFGLIGARTHFCTVVARGNGGTCSPRKYGLNGTIPATVNSRSGSWGIRLADGTMV